MFFILAPFPVGDGVCQMRKDAVMALANEANLGGAVI